MFYLYKPVIVFAAICTIRGGARGEKPFIYTFAFLFKSISCLFAISDYVFDVENP